MPDFSKDIGAVAGVAALAGFVLRSFAAIFAAIGESRASMLGRI